jgi:hypothetical protein
MSKIRSNARLTCHAPVRTRTGTTAANTPWSMSDVEVIDDDMNKVDVSVPTGMVLDVGKAYDCLLESETFYKERGNVGIITAVLSKVG